MKRSHNHLILGTSALVLSVVSVFVVIQGASDEPYTVFRKSDAIVQIGVASVLMFVWLQVAVSVALGVVWDRISTWWLSSLVWVFICQFYLFHSPSGYMRIRLA